MSTDSFPAAIERHLEDDRVAWLTTVTDRGDPFPAPIWFVAAGAGIIVYTTPASRRLHNIDQRPLVSLHFNSDPRGEDIAVVRGRATVEHGTAPSEDPDYLARYGEAIPRLGMTIDEFDRTFSVRITIESTGTWLGP